jgi:mitogen-activated protein kinase 1/3
MKANVAEHANRGPLFPGNSCFPLSPEKKSSASYSRGQRDQLKMIFDVIGTPSDEELAMLAKDARAYVRKQFSPRSAMDFREKYPGASDQVLDLLKRMLCFDAQQRIPVEAALQHPCFRKVKCLASPLPAEPTRVQLSFEGKELDAAGLRRHFLAEQRRFRDSRGAAASPTSSQSPARPRRGSA